MTLPYDALTAALDAWLGQHIPNLYDDGEACFHAFRDEPFRGDGAPPFAPEDAPQHWRYAFARIY